MKSCITKRTLKKRKDIRKKLKIAMKKRFSQKINMRTKNYITKKTSKKKNHTRKELKIKN